MKYSIDENRKIFSKLISATSRTSCKAAILMSGQGSNAEIILRNRKLYPNIEIVTIITDTFDSNASLLARHFNTHMLFVDIPKASNKRLEAFEVISNYMRDRNIGITIYAGFMKIAPPEFVNEFPGINIHPSDLTILDYSSEPKYTGLKCLMNMLENENYLASTVHLICSGVDKGLPLAVSNKLPKNQIEHLNFAEIHSLMKYNCEYPLYSCLISALASGMVSYSNIPLYSRNGCLVDNKGNIVKICTDFVLPHKSTDLIASTRTGIVPYQDDDNKENA